MLQPLVLACALAAAARPDGTLLDKRPFVLPARDELPAGGRDGLTREAYQRVHDATDLELWRIQYVSGGLRVSGFLYHARNVADRKLPLVIWSRGGVGADSAIGLANAWKLYEMYRFAAEGFVVLAPQYRGYDGGEGKQDEIGGGDLDDVLSLVPLARWLSYVDMDRVFLYGFSRGGLVTLQALRAGAAVRAAAVVGAVTDWKARIGTDARTIERRSPIRWVDRIDVPLLVMNGGADTGTPRPACSRSRRSSTRRGGCTSSSSTPGTITSSWGTRRTASAAQSIGSSTRARCPWRRRWREHDISGGCGTDPFRTRRNPVSFLVGTCGNGDHDPRLPRDMARTLAAPSRPLAAAHRCRPPDGSCFRA